MADVAAVILDYYGLEKTVNCLRSLKDQGLNHVLIVDNSGSPEVFSRLVITIQQLPDLDYGVSFLSNGSNLGFARGINEALRWLETNCPHDYYLLLNNDTLAGRGMVTDMLNYLKANPHSKLVAPTIYDGNSFYRGMWYHRILGLILSHKVSNALFYLSGCCLLVSSELTRSDLFDNDFFMYGEDVELGWRLSRSSIPFSVVPNAFIYHEVSASSKQGSPFYEYHINRCHILLAQKLIMHRWEFAVSYTMKIIYLLLRALKRTLVFRTSVPLRAFLKALKN